MKKTTFEVGKLYKCEDLFLVVYPSLAMAKIACDPVDREKNRRPGLTCSGIAGNSSRTDCHPDDASLKTIRWATDRWSKIFNEPITHTYPHDVMIFLEQAEKENGYRFLKFFHPNFLGWIALDTYFERWINHIQPLQPATQEQR